MPKHAARQFILARLVLGSAATILVVLVGWIAVRVGGGPGGTGDPLMVQPTTALQVAGGTLPAPSTESAPLTASASAPASAPVSPTPSRSASARASTKPAPSKSASRTPSAAPSQTSPAPAAGTLAASYSTTASWRDGFIAAVRVVNNGPAASDWSVTLTYPSSDGVAARGAWNGTVSSRGDSITLSGRFLAPGSSINAGFQGTKDSNGAVNPVTCSVGGGSCRMG